MLYLINNYDTAILLSLFSVTKFDVLSQLQFKVMKHLRLFKVITIKFCEGSKMTHVVFILSWVFSTSILNRKFPFMILTFVTLFLFLALRYEYGNDYLSYLYIHSAINDGMAAWGEDEFLFKQLNLIVPNFQWMIALLSFFYVVVVYYLIKKSLPRCYYWIAVMILLINPYLFLIHLSSIRQTIALCFFVIAIYFVFKRKLIPYCIFVLLAAGFHKSAILLIPVYFVLSANRINGKSFFGIVFMLVALLFTPLFDFTLDWVLSFFPRYSYYLTLELGNSLRSTLLTFFYFLMIILNINRLEGKEIIFGKLALLSTSVSILSYKVSMITRMNIYFELFMIVAIPLILYRTKSVGWKLFWFIGSVSIYFLRYYSFFQDPLWEAAYGTYKTILGLP
ncbi:MAG: hypothetical protein C0425_10810 [Chlorobiaceae bacterium]|nr:hypothetical protein [Chlorobiaceae bacterium]